MTSVKANLNRAVFLDRDGVLTPVFLKDQKPYAARTLEEFSLLPGIEGPLESLSRAGFILLVVTNQPDISRGLMDRETLMEMNRRLMLKLGGTCGIKKVYFCPHDDADLCQCRKPKPGMLLQGAQEWNVDLSASFMVGDRASDAAAGKAAGCKTLLIEAPYNKGALCDYRARDLREAVRIILSLEN